MLFTLPRPDYSHKKTFGGVVTFICKTFVGLQGAITFTTPASIRSKYFSYYQLERPEKLTKAPRKPTSSTETSPLTVR